MTVQACEKALAEARVQPSKITHTVGVTCSDTTNPGYDTFVAQRLKLNSNVEQTLLHGVGCAGGLAALRQAANLAVGASQRRRPAQILVFACELCSLFIHAEIFDAWKNGTVRIPAALFSDGAAALVVCNGLGLTENNKPVFELLDWATQRLPGTSCAMDMTVNAHGMHSDPTYLQSDASVFANPLVGYLTTLTKEIPIHTIGAIPPMFNMLCDSFDASHKYNAPKEVRPAHCDWALHPGGAAILQGAQEALDLSADHLRASLDIYKSHGNSSSPTVLIVLDQLRRMGRGRDDVVATSFGPGLTIEMCMMRRCRGLKPEGPRKTVDLITKQRSLRLFSFSSWARLISIR